METEHTNFSQTKIHIMYNQTPIQYLADAIQQKKEWAPAAMRNYLTQHVNIFEIPFSQITYTGLKCSNMWEAICCAFDWAEAPEGFKCWAEVANSIQIELYGEVKIDHTQVNPAPECGQE